VRNGNTIVDTSQKIELESEQYRTDRRNWVHYHAAFVGVH